MGLIKVEDYAKIYGSLKNHLDSLEHETKTPELKGDMLQVAKKVYDQLEKILNEEPGLEANLLSLTLNCIKGKFYSPFGIASDLKNWLKNPSVPDSSSYVWYDLCVGNNS